MPDLYVRVKPKSGADKFHRCAMLFTLAWSLVEVDDATARRLEAEQMLEVSAERPADYTDAQPDTRDQEHASPVDPANNAGEGAKFEAGAHGGGDIYAPDSPAQAQGEAEAAAQARMEADAEEAAAAPRRTAKAKK